MTRRQQTAPTVEVVTDGRFREIESYAAAKVAALLRLAHEPVLSARVRVTRRPQELRRPVVARAAVDVNGRVVHVSAAAPDARACVDELADRLRTRLERNARHWEARRGRASRAAARDGRRARSSRPESARSVRD
jgi:ribosome-associated translation inhibitor RaiA